MNSIDFYFDFSSPYGYFSSEKIEEIADKYNRTVNWKPYLMGAVMKITERKPLVQIPMVNEYSARDLLRTARYEDIPFSIPSKFPVATVAACRAYYWVAQQDQEKAKELCHALFRAYFEKDQLISDSKVVQQIAVGVGVDSMQLSQALQDDQVKLLVRKATDEAISKNVFGSPFFVTDSEPFWGHDRLGQLEAWLKTGGW